MSKRNKKLTVLLGIAALEAYRFYKGKGIFNKIRFKEQHEAVSNYLETHYPDAFYSDITETPEGWSCVINKREEKIVLYMTKTPEDMFVFWEKKI